MNTETLNYVTNPADITKLAAVILQGRTAEDNGKATYLRSLLAATQIELTGKAVQRASRGRQARPDTDEAVTALEKINTEFYQAVLAAVPADLATEERNAKTSFARSAASTLRRAVRLGWNPLTPLGDVTKYNVQKWSDAHDIPKPLSSKKAEKRVMRLIERIGATIAGLAKEDAARILQEAVQELAPELAPQSIRRLSIVKHPERRTAAH